MRWSSSLVDRRFWWTKNETLRRPPPAGHATNGRLRAGHGDEDAARAALLEAFRLEAEAAEGAVTGWLGERDSVNLWLDRLPRSKSNVKELDDDWVDARRLALAACGYATEEWRLIVEQLKDTIQFALQRFAGETAGLRAVLLAIAYRALGNDTAYHEMLSWLITACPDQGGNRSAKAWANFQTVA